MKTNLLSLMAVAALFIASSASLAFADDKEITITGEGKCAKCQLHVADKCQNTVETTVDGKKVVYYCAKNDVSKGFHENLCHAPVKVTATGTVKEVDGKQVLTLSKIELAK